MTGTTLISNVLYQESEVRDVTHTFLYVMVSTIPRIWLPATVQWYNANWIAIAEIILFTKSNTAQNIPLHVNESVDSTKSIKNLQR